VILVKITLRRALAMLTAAALVSFIAVMVSENEAVRTSAVPQSTADAEKDPIEEFRSEREKLRSMQKAQLSDVAHDAAAQDETRELARRQLLELCANEEKELTIEGILSMRGFSNPVVTVHSGSVNVILQAETITRQQSGVILDLVSRETGAMSGDVKIIPIN